jgi:hypothetical protein
MAAINHGSKESWGENRLSQVFLYQGSSALIGGRYGLLRNRKTAISRRSTPMNADKKNTIRIGGWCRRGWMGDPIWRGTPPSFSRTGRQSIIWSLFYQRSSAFIGGQYLFLFAHGNTNSWKHKRMGRADERR